MTIRYSFAALAAGVLAAGFLMAPAPAAADPVADFYKGKRMEMLIGYSSGGGYDTYARVVARHWPRLIPAQPTMTPRNVPGAGSMRLMNEMYNTRPKDGTAVATVSRGIVHEELWGNQGVQFRANEMHWIGSANNEVSVCAFWKTAPAATVNDLLNNELVVGGTGPGADTDAFPQVMNNVFGSKLKLVTGYPGGNDINFAIERGEVQGRCGWSWSSVVATRAQWLKNKDILIPIQMALTKHADLADVPLVMDLARNEREKQLLTLVFARQTMGRPFLTTDQVPAERVAMLRKTFMQLMEDKQFLAETEKARLEITPVSGEEVQQLVSSLFQFPKDVIEASRLAASDAARTQVVKAVVPEVTVTARVAAVQRGGERVQWQGDTAKGRVNLDGKTEVTVAGNKATGADLKEGMTCDFKILGVETALAIACK